MKTISFSENVKIHLTNNTSDLSEEGFNYSFPISIIPDKIGEISTMILVYFKVRRKDGSIKPYEKIVPIEIKAKVEKKRIVNLFNGYFLDNRKQIRLKRNGESIYFFRRNMDLFI